MKMRPLRYLPWIGLLALPAALPAQDTAPNLSQLSDAIDAQISQPRYAWASWGIAITSLDTGRTLYAHAADTLMQPASTAKLFTAALALSTLGQDYSIPTQLLSTAPVNGGSVQGELILRGMGDPTLGTPSHNPDWADQLASQLAARGIREIDGDLVADDTYFSGPPYGSGWEAGDLQSAFAAPTSALSVGENVMNVSVTPTEPGQAAEVSVDPPQATPPLVNTLVTSNAHAHGDINLYRAPASGVLYAFGSVAARSQPQNFQLSVADPAAYAGTLLRDALARHQIRLNGRLRVLHWPQQPTTLEAGASVVAQVSSAPLLQVLGEGLKRSQNLYLQNLLQISGVFAQAQAAREGNLPPGFTSSEAWGIRALQPLLDRIGMTPQSVSITDGSGLSRQDLASPASMVRLLAWLAAQPYGDALRESLPQAGVDGTLQWRMKNTPAANNVHAKTGSMSGVRCLAGYVTTAVGEHLAFVIMLNHAVQPEGEQSPSRTIDAIAELLAAFRGHS